jgi:hypothetical protein
VSDFNLIQSRQRQKALEQMQSSSERAMNTQMRMLWRFTVKSTSVKEHRLNLLMKMDGKIEEALNQTANRALTDIKQCITDDRSPLCEAETRLAKGECAI